MEEPFTSKRRRKSSFYRKSVGVSEFGDQNVPPSEMGLTTFNLPSTFPNFDSTFSSRESTISPRQIDFLKSEAKQRKEFLKNLKNQYQSLRSEEFSAIDWVREGPRFTEADKKFISEMPNYNEIFSKHEELKEMMLIEARTRVKLDGITEEFLNIMETKLKDQKTELIKRLSSEIMKISDILEPLSESSNSGYMLDPFLSDSDSELEWEKMNS